MTPKKTLAAYIGAVIIGVALQILGLWFFPLAFDSFGWWAVPAFVVLTIGTIAVRSSPRMRSLAEYGFIGSVGIALSLLAIGHLDLEYHTLGQTIPILVVGTVITVSAVGAGIAQASEQPAV